MTKKDITNKERALFEKLLGALGVFFGVYLILVMLQPIAFKDRFGADTTIAGVNVSGKKTAEAKKLLEKKWNEYKNTQIEINGTKIAATDIVLEPDYEATFAESLDNEQHGILYFSKILPHAHDLEFKYNDAGIQKLLLTTYDKTSTTPVDAAITNIDKGTIKSEVVGRKLLLVESRAKLQEEIEWLPTKIDLVFENQKPSLTKTEAENILADVKNSVSRPVRVSYAGKTEEISTNTLKSWLKITPLKPATLLEYNYIFNNMSGDYHYLDVNKVFLYTNSLAKNIDVTAKNATLDFADNKLTVTKNEVIGKTLNRTKTSADIQSAVKGDHQVTLEVAEAKPEVRSDNLASLGIKEQISVGWSDGAGSPVNRKHNFTVGASKFDGVLIKPGEVFSFNKALGPVDASTGYLPELVILADKTVPEYGGGLCQVSSTAFRAALNAGLPINERHWHAYPVGYYKPFGVDATIYLPSPDLKFTNDTGSYILIQTKIVGTKVYFEFYGTRKPGKVTFSGNDKADGAVPVVEQVTPYIYDQDVRGPKSFTAVFYRHIYDAAGKLTDNDKFTSKYDTPDKYPH